MNAAKHPIDKWSVYFAIGFLSFCGIMMFSLLPLVVGALKRHYGLPGARLGDIVASYYAGSTLIALTTPAWMRKVDWRIVAVVGQLIAAIPFLIMMLRDCTVGQLMVLMGVAGLGGGIAYSLSFTLLGDSDAPDRAFGINMIFQGTLATISVLVLPLILVNDGTDLARLFMLVTSVVIPITIVAFWLPKAGPKADPNSGSRTAHGSGRLLWLPILGTMASFLLMMANTAPYVFIEQVGISRGLAPSFIDLALGAAQFMAMLGGLAAALAANRVGRLLAMCIAGGIYLAAIGFLYSFHSEASFALGAALLFLPINFQLAFSLGVTADLDIEGRVIGISSASICAPSLVAPPIVGRLFERYGFESNLWIGVVSAAAGTLLYGYLAQRASQIASDRVTLLERVPPG